MWLWQIIVTIKESENGFVRKFRIILKKFRVILLSWRTEGIASPASLDPRPRLSRPPSIHLCPEHRLALPAIQGTKNLGNEFFFPRTRHPLESPWHGSMWRVSRPMRPTQRRPDPVLFPASRRFIDTRIRTWSDSTLRAERMLITVDTFDTRVAFVPDTFTHRIFVDLGNTRGIKIDRIPSIDQRKVSFDVEPSFAKPSREEPSSPPSN